MATIPESHLDLILEPIDGVLTTLMPDGQPQMSIVWADYDGQYVLINTTLERQKGKNMVANPRVNVLIIDPSNGARFLEVRGEVTEITQECAVAHADKQTQAYSNGAQKRFYGDIYPEEQQVKETRVIVKIYPKKITTDAIFS
ncbi:MAG: PPOX class F420-dependent oxidoreductase [Anaerolineales bacterium]|jgi:PPOX class probable F420-dependent enzyme